MLYNKNIVGEILLSEFSEEIEANVEYYLLMIDQQRLQQYFDVPVEAIDFGEIDEVEVRQFDVEKEGAAAKVYGSVKISVYLDGYEMVKDDMLLVDTAKVDLGFGFSFEQKEKIYNNFKMEFLFIDGTVDND